MKSLLFSAMVPRYSRNQQIYQHSTSSVEKTCDCHGFLDYPNHLLRPGFYHTDTIPMLLEGNEEKRLLVDNLVAKLVLDLVRKLLNFTPDQGSLIDTPEYSWILLKNPPWRVHIGHWQCHCRLFRRKWIRRQSKDTCRHAGTFEMRIRRASNASHRITTDRHGAGETPMYGPVWRGVLSDLRKPILCVRPNPCISGSQLAQSSSA